MRILIAGLGLLLPLMGCEQAPPIAGGPCSYETSIITATVIEVDEDGALFDGPDGEAWVPAEYLGSLPEVGETLTLTVGLGILAALIGVALINLPARRPPLAA